MTGPCLTGFTQSLNDWFDRHVDAVNEPYRPIPTLRINADQVWEQIYALLAVGLGFALGIDAYTGHLPEEPVVLPIALLGVFLAVIYSAPPIRLKASGWLGSYALGF